MSDTWIMGATAAQDRYRPADDPWAMPEPAPIPPTTRRVIITGSEDDPWPLRVAKGVGSAVSNVASGLAEDIPKAGRWFLEQARKSPEEAQRDVRNVMGGLARGVYEIPQKAIEASGRYATGGDYEAGPILDAALLGTGGGSFGAAAKPGEMVLGAGRVRRRPPPRPVAEELPPPPIGHNMPPPEMQIAAPAVEPMVAEAAPVVERTWAQELPRPKPAKRATEVPNIRGLDVRDAIAIARLQHHLVQAGDQSEGYFVGGPRDVQSKAALNKLRRDFDAYIAQDTRGGDWYDRYRGGLASVTGNDPTQNLWMANQEGQWSAGVDPGSELHFALKENNASIAGMPVKAARPAQHEAHLAALAAKDPSQYQLGDKTGEYAELVNPDVVKTRPPGATGVNDFRHAQNWKYTEAGGEAQRDALTSAQHRFLDYETALAVDRANRIKLGGRDDWTGEKIQAAPWVVQKALAIQSRNPALSYEEAFARANTTIADYFPRHTAYATYEAQPGAGVTSHMMGSVAAPQSERVAYAGDPASTWATAPGGRDAIYSGLGVEGTGNVMRVRPSVEMQGYYRRPDDFIETNPGEVARPLVTFNTARQYDKEFIGPRESEPFKVLTPHDRALLEGGEALRGYIDAQNASAFHKNWSGGPQSELNALFFPRPGKATPDEMRRIQDAGRAYGLGDVVDTGQGLTAASFYPELTTEQVAALGKAVRKNEFKEFGEPTRVRTEGGYVDYTEKWPEGVGSGAATRHMLDYVAKTPEMRDAFNRNPYIAERALARLERDEAWASKWGAPREDIQNARRIIGDGPGWVDRLEEALRKGTIALPSVAAIFAVGAHAVKQGEDRAL